MKKFIAGVVAIILSLLIATPALADGGFFVTNPETDVYEPSQKALILYQDNREDLILSVRYEGDADKFAWVIPVPNKPEIAVADPELFWELSWFTRVIIPSGGFGCLSGSQVSEEPGVKVIEEKIVGPYATATLSAKDPGALTNWLDANGYLFPEAGKEILDEYINKQWYFVAAKINTGEEAVGLSEGTIEPLRLSFESDEIVYPLRITSLSSKQSEVLLYVFADGKVLPKQYQFLSLNTPEQLAQSMSVREDNIFYIEFGEQIALGRIYSQSVYEALTKLLIDLLGDEFYIDDYYLTKLRADISADNMVDIELIKYEDSNFLDSDGDGWSDAEEAIVGTDTSQVDTDGDGIPDPEDPAPLTSEAPPDWSLPVALASTLVIAFIIWLPTWRRLRRRATD